MHTENMKPSYLAKWHHARRCGALSANTVAMDEQNTNNGAVVIQNGSLFRPTFALLLMRPLRMASYNANFTAGRPSGLDSIALGFSIAAMLHETNAHACPLE